MPKAFVTGGTGFVGRNLIERLRQADWHVTGLHRGDEVPAQWAELGVAPMRGDITAADSVVGRLPGDLDAVFHAAADTSPWRGHRERQRRVNVNGTANMLAAARTAGARRFVHVSTVSVYGHHRDVVTEETPQQGRGSWVGYVRTKAEAEDLVRQAVADGLDAVICNPAHILGRYDTSGWARLFLLVDRDALPGVPPGGGCFANVGDVADGLIAAAERGRSGENYILAGPHATFLAVVQEIGRLLGKQVPARTVPALLLKVAARMADLTSRITGKPPQITPEGVYFVVHDERVSSQKAKEQLGYGETPLARSLEEAYAWLAEQQLISPRH